MRRVSSSLTRCTKNRGVEQLVARWAHNPKVVCSSQTSATMSEKEELEKLVKECNSLSDILRKQKKSISGTSIKILKDKLDSYGISYLFLNNKSIPKQIPLKEILVENRPYKSSELKRRLIKDGLKEDKCEICGCINEWNGNPLVLQLDHINGNHNDNRLENLRILCPNCHSQTETFGNKRKKQNYCIDCGKEISKKSTRCGSCASKFKNNFKIKPEDRPTKDELFKLIKENSFTSIGKMYGVKDNAIRKWCKNYNLPYTKKELRKL